MGSITRVQVWYGSLESYLSKAEQPVYGAFLDGENVHQAAFPGEGILLMGSESHGIADSLKPFITKHISIPGFGGAESLNVAIAAAVIIDNIKRSHANR